MFMCPLLRLHEALETAWCEADNCSINRRKNSQHVTATEHLYFRHIKFSNQGQTERILMQLSAKYDLKMPQEAHTTNPETKRKTGV